MSKLKGKDLSFDTDAAQPAFLQRLRGRIAGDTSGRHEVPIPRNKRLAQDDEEDAPTYVLEGTDQSLTKAEYEALISGEKDTAEDKEQPDTDSKDENDDNKAGKEKPKDNIAELGKIVKKRKVAKIIGADTDEGDEAKEVGKANAKVTKKPKKKGAKVKLSFGDQDEG